MILSGLPNLISFQTNGELPNTIFTVATSLKDQLQQVEEQCIQGQQKGEELRKKRAELLEVLRVFEMIEGNEKAKTQRMELELAHAERDATERYRSALGGATTWTQIAPSADDVFGPSTENRLAVKTRSQDRTTVVAGLRHSPSKKTESPRNIIPQRCKQMITSLMSSAEDPLDARIQTDQSRNNQQIETKYNANPRAPLISEAEKDNGQAKKRVRRVLALEKAKRKAAATLKTMPHKARRKIKETHAPRFAPKKTLAYTGEAIRSMATGLGMIGSLWNSHQRLSDGIPASETWPEAMRSFLAAGSSLKVMVQETTETFRD